MEVYRDEEEQVQAIKDWWKTNGTRVVILTVLLIAVVAGTKYWMYSQELAAEAASAQYKKVLDLVETNQDEALSAGAVVLEKYSSTAYAGMTAMVMAAIEVEQNKLSDAELHLRWAMEHGDAATVTTIARLRLARVLLALSRLDEAEALLDVAVPEAYAGRLAHARGDIQLQRGDFAGAQGAYQTALNHRQTTPTEKRVLQMKLDDLAIPGS